MYVTKASGEKEQFQPDKIRHTLARSGAPKPVIENIIKRVEQNLYDGIPTSEILRVALQYLDNEMPHIASRYDLKGAIMRLGPAGYQFEQFVSEVLREQGFSTKVHSIILGFCVAHEIDVIAKKDTTYMVEVKYHNSPGIYTGVKDALYTQARFEDLVDGHKAGKCEQFDKPWLVCNTKFSEEVIRYAKCKGMRLLGWQYPEESLKKILESKRLYPITALRNVDDYSREKLSQAGLMLCKDLSKKSPEELKKITGIHTKKLSVIIKDAQRLCGA